MRRRSCCRIRAMRVRKPVRELRRRKTDVLPLSKAVRRFHSDFSRADFSTDLRHGGSRNGPCHRLEQGVSLRIFCTISETVLRLHNAYYSLLGKTSEISDVFESDACRNRHGDIADSDDVVPASCAVQACLPRGTSCWQDFRPALGITL